MQRSSFYQENKIGDIDVLRHMSAVEMWPLHPVYSPARQQHNDGDGPRQRSDSCFMMKGGSAVKIDYDLESHPCDGFGATFQAFLHLFTIPTARFQPPPSCSTTTCSRQRITCASPSSMLTCDGRGKRCSDPWVELFQIVHGVPHDIRFAVPHGLLTHILPFSPRNCHIVAAHEDHASLDEQPLKVTFPRVEDQAPSLFCFGLDAVQSVRRGWWLCSSLFRDRRTQHAATTLNCSGLGMASSTLACTRAKARIAYWSCAVTKIP